jgi:phage gpG-like protein
MLQVNIDDSNVIQALQRLEALFNPPDGILKALASKTHQDTMARFASKTDPDGRAWKPLSPVTIARKKQNKDKILIETDEMRKSIGAVFGADNFSYGTDNWKAPFHQYGTSKIPRRQFIGFPDDEIPAYLSIIEQKILLTWNN